MKLIELLFQILKLNKDSTNKALIDSNFFGEVSNLLGAYPWNNFLQLKVIVIYEELLENWPRESQRQALAGSNIGPTLVALSQQSTFSHVSGRPIRHGHMAVIVKIANILVKNKATNEEVASYLDSLDDSWRRFNEGELKASNDKNTRSLGGQQPRSLPGDDDEMEGSMSMDAILQRFSNFNSESQKRSPSQDFNDDDDEDEEEEDSGKEEGKTEGED